ncbi:MAG: TatD family hydrolase, partial [Patescibacteria group bacterium]
EDWGGGIELAKQYPENIYFAFGLHCEEAAGTGGIKLKIEALENKINQLDPDFIKAIGETGLDYFYAKTPEAKQNQQELFLSQIELAKKYQKPLIIHCREAYEEIYQILKAEKINNFVMHFFVGTKNQAEKFLELGGYISFSSVVALADDYDKVIEFVPEDRILIETDSPFIRSNTPLDVFKVAEKIARVKKISYDEIVKTTYENAKRFFQPNALNKPNLD